MTKDHQPNVHPPPALLLPQHSLTSVCLLIVSFFLHKVDSTVEYVDHQSHFLRAPTSPPVKNHQVNGIFHEFLLEFFLQSFEQVHDW
nr:hypothetical protein Iba_chr02aCG13920 [Ipomoea batatas]GMC61062.1 hypothetical protein Iba_chr02bCG16480 [Ipomoea batatas]GMC63273.1 hypothetical protein Iba_chr02cCG11800 [Ipomoea batatas]GMC64836.1 hypothetical protein Iba_chr02dCG8630 [Ipomoea batatas]GMD92625.1 hypothetical protein Iba_scaffold405945CG0010 [Ipomoea batatas]